MLKRTVRINITVFLLCFFVKCWSRMYVIFFYYVMSVLFEMRVSYFGKIYNTTIWSIPLDSLREQIADYCTDYEKTIYVYCKSGERSKEAAKLLRSMGYVNTFDIGSIHDWK